jgi:hypothetical protein
VEYIVLELEHLPLVGDIGSEYFGFRANLANLSGHGRQLLHVARHQRQPDAGRPQC